MPDKDGTRTKVLFLIDLVFYYSYMDISIENWLRGKRQEVGRRWANARDDGHWQFQTREGMGIVLLKFLSIVLDIVALPHVSPAWVAWQL